MPFTFYIKNAWLNTIRGGGVGANFTAPTTVYASLHTANPGDTGTNEVTGGSPAYARKSVVHGAASAGASSGTTLPVFDVPSGVTVNHVGYWDALTGGNFLGYDDVTPEAFAAQGTYTLSSDARNLNL